MVSSVFLVGGQTLSTLAGFLAVEEADLEAMLTQRAVVTRGETFTKLLSVADANLTRDAIVKSLYEVSTQEKRLIFCGLIRSVGGDPCVDLEINRRGGRQRRLSKS